MRIYINSFGGMQPNTDARLLPTSGAQTAHNCLLEDGSLQAMPQWEAVGDGPISVGDPAAGTQYTAYAGYCGMTFYGPPFGLASIYLNASGLLLPSVSSSATGSMTVTPGLLSKKAVNRVYGVTSLFSVGGTDYESDLTVVANANARQVMYEGDNAAISISGTGTALRLYRSTSDVTTGAGTNGAVTANWQLVAQLAGTAAVYVDAGPATADVFDTYLYRGSTQQPFLAFRMGLLESGFVWLVSEDGQIALSDRFSWGYWPVENVYSLGNRPEGAGVTVTGTASVGDTLYVGTQVGVYACQARVTEAGAVVLGITAIHKALPCLPNTLVATPQGAMYTSVHGVVGLEGAQATLLSRGLARGVFGYDPKGEALEFSAIGNAVYHGGRYYGVSGGLPPPLSLAGHLVNGYKSTTVNYQYLVGGGTTPRVVSLFSGLLPTGLSINSSGLVTGTRAVAGTYTYRLKAIDALGDIVYLDDTSQVVSTDIVNWVTAITGTAQSPSTSGVSGSIVLIVCNNSFLSVSSDSGVTWATQTLIGLAAPYYIILFQGDWYIFEGTSRYGAMKTVGALLPLVFTPFGNVPSTSGLGVLGNYLYSGQYGNTGTYKLEKMISPGSAWQTIDTGVSIVSPAGSTISAMVFTGSAYIFVTTDGEILRSTDLLYFTKQATGLAALHGVVVLYGILVASGGSTDAYRSADDGLTWAAIPAGAIGSVVATPSMFVSGYGHTVKTSVDGLTWTARYTDIYSGGVSGFPSNTPTLAVFPIQSGQAYVGNA